MEDKDSKDSPFSDWRAFLFDYIINFSDRFMKGNLRAVIVQAFLIISPSIPFDIRKSFGEKNLKSLFGISFAIAIFFCLFVTAFLCLIEGTLYGSDISRRYFIQDGWNIVLYTLICPIYCALSCCVIAITIGVEYFG